MENMTDATATRLESRVSSKVSRTVRRRGGGKVPQSIILRQLACFLSYQLPSHAAQDQAPPTTPEQATPHQLKQLWSRIHQHGIDPEVFRAYLAKLGLSSTKQLTSEQLDQCLSEIDTRQGEAFQPTDDTEPLPASQATRTILAEALAMLQSELEQARQQGALDQLDTDWLDKLAQWAPVVKAACESPGTPEAELCRYLQDTHQVLSDLRQMLTTEAAA